MKNQGSDKFLNICFNAGKILSIVMLFITLITFCVSGVVLLCLQSSNVEIPSFKTFEKLIEKEVNPQTAENDSKVKSNESSVPDKEIDRIIKKNKLNYQVKKFIVDDYLDVPNNYRKSYLLGFDSFCKDGLLILNKNDKLMRFFNTEYKTNDWGEEYEDTTASVMKDGVYNLTISKHFVEAYSSLFEKNLKKTKVQDQEKIATKIIAGVVLFVSLLLFVMFLFLPVLIKIEENTKNLLVVQEKGK